MSESTVSGYRLWQCSPNGTIKELGVLGVTYSASNNIDELSFQYDQDYLQSGFSIDPVALNFTGEVQVFKPEKGSLPGFVDDLLPDKWGQKLLAMSQEKRYPDKRSLIDNAHRFANLSDITLTDYSNKKAPNLVTSIPLKEVESRLVGEDIDFSDSGMILRNLPLFLAGGGSPGGARPKLLVSDDIEWLYKFNLKNDPFDMAIAEWACLEVAHRAELNVPRHEIVKLNGQNCFRIERFDVSPQGGRYHLMTLNSLLKNEYCIDPFIAHYEEIAALIRKYSYQAEEDCKQLLGQLLINTELKNTDDHLRNFSFIHDSKGWKLTPAYDITPNLTVGNYHQLHLNKKNFFPSIDNAVEMGMFLGISKKSSEDVQARVMNALSQWEKILRSTDINDHDLDKLLMIGQQKIK